MKLNDVNGIIPFLVEDCAFEGVKRIAAKVAEDAEKVTGLKPQITNEFACGSGGLKGTILFATLGKSLIIDELISGGKFDLSDIKGKREVYKTVFIKNPFPGVDEILLICGSDKRGTIYGMFNLSEYIGVSPLCYWGDARPLKREAVEINNDIETVSKEPSIKYRGFFINDEWPCFGNWANSHFGGVNAKMYDNVFELLLRLKGNYLWPAMWASSFPLDGPGSQNEELADIYGVIMGASHHEPCLRASEEWDKVRGLESEYGNEWNYYTNRNGLLKYWKDALIRSGKYEHIITIGMRGERDSSMLGPSASLKENIDLLKDIITNQKKLISENLDKDLSEVPLMLALYKEVEEYYYGGGDTAGLKDWEGLDGVICMLCEDNFGFMRTLPSEEIRNRSFGMYYHFDYHGGPVSYEWMPSVPYSKVWEQMSMAYDYGIRDIWIVNVGDLKFNEVPLSYFMDLAYDFDKWGTSAPNSQDEYVEGWLGSTFPSVDESLRQKMAFVLERYIKMNGMRRPEALNSKIYHPCHYLEADRMLLMAGEIENINEEVFGQLNERDKDAYYSMIYFPAKSSINLLRMHLYAGKNEHYAAQGKPIANEYSALVTKCIGEDRRLAAELGGFLGGKWKGMELEQHIGFTRWNDDNYKYPLRIEVEPAHKPRLIVSRKDSVETYSKVYGPPMTVKVDDFLYEGNTEVILELANDGIGSIDYNIEFTGKQPDWLILSSTGGNITLQEDLILSCVREKLPVKAETARFIIRDKETKIAVEVKGEKVNTESLPSWTFLENKGIITIEANHFISSKETEKGRFIALNKYGRSGNGMKVYPTTVDFNDTEDRPSLTYSFLIENTGGYEIEIWTTPTNSVINKRHLCLMVNDNIIETLSADFKAGDNSDSKWCDGVMRQIRVTKTKLVFDKEGVHELTIGAMEAGLVLERILIYKKADAPKASYLGPLESYFVK